MIREVWLDNAMETRLLIAACHMFLLCHGRHWPSCFLLLAACKLSYTIAALPKHLSWIQIKEPYSLSPNHLQLPCLQPILFDNLKIDCQSFSSTRDVEVTANFQSWKLRLKKQTTKQNLYLGASLALNQRGVEPLLKALDLSHIWETKDDPPASPTHLYFFSFTGKGERIQRASTILRVFQEEVAGCVWNPLWPEGVFRPHPVQSRCHTLEEPSLLGSHSLRYMSLVSRIGFSNTKN